MQSLPRPGLKSTVAVGALGGASMRVTLGLSRWGALTELNRPWSTAYNHAQARARTHTPCWLLRLHERPAIRGGGLRTVYNLICAPKSPTVPPPNLYPSSYIFTAKRSCFPLSNTNISSPCLVDGPIERADWAANAVKLGG
jgi:hypothetical protein